MADTTKGKQDVHCGLAYILPVVRLLLATTVGNVPLPRTDSPVLE